MAVSCVLLHALKIPTFMETQVQDFVKVLAQTINIVIQLTERALLHVKQKGFSCTTLHVSSSVHLVFMLMDQEFVCHLVQPILMEKTQLLNAWEPVLLDMLKVAFAWQNVMTDCSVKTLSANHLAQPH